MQQAMRRTTVLASTFISPTAGRGAATATFIPGRAPGVPQAYVDALLRELRRPHPAPDTVYFGGGTPALLTPAQAAALFKAAAPRPRGGDNAGSQPRRRHPPKRWRAFTAPGSTG